MLKAKWRSADKGRADHAWRAWYKTPEWAARRRAQRARRPLCERCEALGRVRAMHVADHVVPHRGDRALFFRGELQSLCKECHDGWKQATERAFEAGEVGVAELRAARIKAADRGGGSDP